MILRNLILAPLATIALAPGAIAQLPGAKLDSVFPPSAPVGSSLEVSVGGSDLNEAQRLEFSHPGIVGEPVVSSSDPFASRPLWQRHRFEVTVAPDVPPGIYRTWFAGAYGLSNSRAFVVSDLPQPAEAGGNGSRESAAEIALNSVAVGRVDAMKVDCFKIALQAGRKVVFDCQAKRLGSRLDAQVAIYDAVGQRLARQRGAGNSDPVIVFDPPREGLYFVEVNDFLAGGGADYLFRLVVSDRPHIASVFPPAGVPGTRSKHQLRGANLPGGGESLEIEIAVPERPSEIGGALPLSPREIRSAGMTYRIDNSNPVRIPFASAPVVIEDPDAVVQKVVPPCEIAGHLTPAPDSDTFEFDATKGEEWIVEAFSHRAGYATDLYLTVSRIVVDADGNRTEQILAEADDEAGDTGGLSVATDSRDPVLGFTAPEDGSYRVRVIDQFELDDFHASYRLALRHPAPDFALIAEIANPVRDPKRRENWAPTLLRGGRLKIGVKALRRDGFDGAIQLGLEGAPPGVEVHGGTIGKGRNRGSITLSGAADLGAGVGQLKIVGRSKGIERGASSVSLVNEVADSNNEAVVPELGHPLLVATDDRSVPLAVSADVSEVVETSLGGRIEIPLKLAKAGEFKGNAKFYLEGIPGIAKPPTLDLDANSVGEGKLGVVITPTNDNKYLPGRFEVCVRGDAVLKYLPDPLGLAAAMEEQKAVENRVAQAGEALAIAEARKGEIAQAGLTEEEKVTQSAAAQAAVVEAQGRKEAAEKAKGRALELVKQAEARNAPRDVGIAGYSLPFVLDIAPAPLVFKDVAPEIRVAKGGGEELPVAFERRFGFAEAVELSLLPPKDLKGFDVPAVSVGKE